MSKGTDAGQIRTQPHSRRSSTAARVALMVCSTLLTLAAVELTLRVKFAMTPSRDFEALQHESQFVDPQGEARLGELVRPSENPRIIYELIPNVATVFKGKSLHVNKEGFRGPAYPHRKPDNTIRILGLGDSVMFGWGVEEQETYLALLAERLKARNASHDWQVINTAVPGYNTSMEAAVLRSRGLAYSPDLVVVGYVPNDLDLPNFLLKEPDPWAMSDCFLADYLCRGLRPSRLVTGKRGGHCVVFNSETDMARVPERYRYMVGEEGFRKAMSEMGDARREHGFEMLVFSYIGKADHHQKIRGIVEDLELPFLSADGETKRYMGQQGIRKWPGSKLVVGDDDPHPSAVWHDLLATTMLEHLESSGVIDRLSADCVARQQSPRQTATEKR